MHNDSNEQSPPLRLEEAKKREELLFMPPSSKKDSFSYRARFFQRINKYIPNGEVTPQSQ